MQSLVIHKNVGAFAFYALCYIYISSGKMKSTRGYLKFIEGNFEKTI